MQLVSPFESVPVGVFSYFLHYKYSYLVWQCSAKTAHALGSCPSALSQGRGGGAGQRVRGPTLTMKFEKWISNANGTCPQEKFHNF